MISGILLSGGLDSAVALAIMAADPKVTNIHALFIHYHQHSSMRETNAAHDLAQHYHVPLEIKHISLWPVQIDPDTWEHAEIPYRNGVLLAIGAAWVQDMGGGELWHGIHPSYDLKISYADTTREFLDYTRIAVHVGTDGKVKLMSPFYLHKNKRETVEKGNQLGVDWSLTHTCFYNELRPCGVCPTCIQRAQAFEDAGVKDTAYA